jgi:hypothetical protein
MASACGREQVLTSCRTPPDRASSQLFLGPAHALATE